MRVLLAVSLALCCIFDVRASQVGLTAAEIAQFHAVNHASHEVAQDNGDGNWLITSDGLVDSAETHLFGGRGSLNPNTVQSQAHQWTLPQTVTYRSEAGCLPMGTIGVAVDGVPFFNPYTAQQTDAVINEQFDKCKGHPDPRGK